MRAAHLILTLAFLLGSLGCKTPMAKNSDWSGLLQMGAMPGETSFTVMLAGNKLVYSRESRFWTKSMTATLSTEQTESIKALWKKAATEPEELVDPLVICGSYSALWREPNGEVQSQRLKYHYEPLKNHRLKRKASLLNNLMEEIERLAPKRLEEW